MRVLVTCARLKHGDRNFHKGGVLEMSDGDAEVAIREGNVVLAPEDATLSEGTSASPWGSPADPTGDEPEAGAHAVRSAIEASK